MDRNPISDLEALAAMPGLEDLADILVRHVSSGRLKRPQALGVLIFLGGRWAFGSANACESALRSTNLWDGLRESAARVGRFLPETPPTYHQYEKIRRRLGEDLPHELSEAFSAAAVNLAQSIGLLSAEPTSRWDAPSPGSVIYGDGSVFAPMSEVTFDENGEVKGSRAKENPRLGPHFKGKKGNESLVGVPITLVGVHGRKRWQRVILGVDLFLDRNEIGSAMGVLSRVIGLASGGVSHVVYDRLMQGTHIRELLRLGVVPIVEMPEASPTQPHLLLPYELQRGGYRSDGRHEKRKGKGARHRSSDKVAPKARLSLHYLRTEAHETVIGPCHHELWALDGALVCTTPGVEVSLDAPVVECLSARFEDGEDDRRLLGTHRVPCRHGSFSVEIDFTASRPSSRTPKRELALADWLRPIPEVSSAIDGLAGLRSDVESSFSWLKSLLPRGRAGSLEPEAFFLDVIGAGLLCNAIAWDVHAARHTRCAQHEAHLDRRGRRRRTVTI